MKITSSAKLILEKKFKELSKELSQEEKKKDKDILYFQAKRKEFSELEKIINSLEAVEFSEKEPATVIIGTKVVLEDMKTGDNREYTIMTRSTSNPMKAIISNESPLAQKMLNLKLGNTFKFKDFSGYEEVYKIKTIEQ